ncbi:ABC transporter ATP-binding protein [Microbacterium caowuchunii]|uniref:ABC transporter ATP-binding protein n=1 Tax=Microbacterium caowuchunii TaxID=2614638 RepID=A0A5N0TK18_9MICO|nr:ABC transporter ATP-binding protein [Microbacterium caowuchunii]KAA9133669.1 ABC transporter ATP-binding protein [Microbacterium caowuchunii]
MTMLEKTTTGGPGGGEDDAVLTVDDLRITFSRGGKLIHAVNGLSYTLRRGRMLAIIGESGSGKSVSVRALMGLLPPSAYITGSARLHDIELIGRSDKAMREIRGRDVAMVFQDPARSLNPTMSVGAQITEALRMQSEISRKAAAERAVELLKLVRLPAAERRFHEYPHQLSGGMRQRVMIAIALAGNPKVLIADEATTALDVTTQAQIMELLVDLQERLGTAVILISHDLGLAASYADDVLVMYAGRAVEHAATSTLFRNVRMPYTKALLGAIPQLTTVPHSQLTVIGGQPPDLSALPTGCPFRPRCPKATEKCEEAPPLDEHEPGHWYACWHPVSRDDPALTGGAIDETAPEVAGPPANADTEDASAAADEHEEVVR